MSCNLPFHASFRLVLGLLLLTAVFETSALSQAEDGEPRLISPVKYALPPAVLAAEISGNAIVSMHIDTLGRPTSAVLVNGPMWPCGTHPVVALEELSSTLSAVMMKQRFFPAMNGGRPVEANVSVTVELKNPRLTTVPAAIDPATRRPKPALISGGILNGKATSLQRPQYPPEARANRDVGSVTVQVLVDEKGNVVRAGTLSGAPSLQFAARDAACDSKFPPTTIEGYPVKVSGVLTYNFSP